MEGRADMNDRMSDIKQQNSENSGTLVLKECVRSSTGKSYSATYTKEELRKMINKYLLNSKG